MTKRMLRKRHVQGETVGRQLVQWLNSRIKTASHRRIEAVLDNLTHIWGWDVYRPKMKVVKKDLSPALIDLAELADPDAHEKMESWAPVKKLRRELSRHRFSLKIYLDPWNPDETLTLGWDVRTEEQKMLLLLVRLCEVGQLHKIRRCRQCRRWFFARKADQLQCSQRCRVSYNQSSPKFKAGRAAYMRQRRQDERDRETRFLDQLGRQKSKR